MRRLLPALSLLSALAIAAPAAAQSKPVSFNIGGGPTFLAGDIADSFNTGWNFQLGAEVKVARHVGIEAEYMYNRMNGPQRVFNGQIGADSVLIESNHQMHVASFNLVLRSDPNGVVAGYVLAGPGIYHRIVQLTTPSVGFATVCDPYWFVCYPVAVSVDQIVGERSSTDFGFDVGGGVTFGHAQQVFVETRFHYVWGPEYTAPSGTKVSATAQYYPITFGLRF